MDHQQKKFTSAAALIFIALTSFLFAAESIEFHVATTGKDENSGTLEKPFLTIERARDAIRESGFAGKKTCSVWIHDGLYRRSQTFSLEAQDSGTAEHPIIYRAKGKAARFVGGKVVPAAAFSLVTDPATLARIPKAAQGKIYMLDLAAHGIEHAAAYPDKFADNGGIFELFCDNKRMPVSRYPNTHGEMTIKRILLNGGGQEKPGRWRDYYDSTPEKKRALESGKGPRPGVFEFGPEHADAHARFAKVIDRGVWIKGYWRVVWENETVRVASIDTEKQTVTLAAPVVGGIGSKYHRPEGTGAEIYWIMNLLEALDRPGEWAIDFQDKKLFFYPSKPLAETDIIISDSKTPIIELKGTSHVEIRGLTIEGSLSDGIRIVDGSSNAIRGCTVRNVTKYGVVVEGGFRHIVESCELHALGSGGVWLSGGDAKATPRIPAGHRVENCDIHHFGEIERVYAPGINVGFRGGGGGSQIVDAVGMIIRHNAIHHCPHVGVLFNSFDNLFEYNEIFQYALVSNDMGAFYSYSKPGGIGHNTFRYNFMHSSPEGEGIYYDNIANHARIYGNIAYRLGPITAEKKAKRGCGLLIKNFGNQRVDISHNIVVDCKTGYSINPGEGSIIRDNIAVGCGDSKGARRLQTYQKDPGFVDLSAMNLALRPDSAVYSDLKNFPVIPFQKIGLKVDQFRKELPPYRLQLADWEPKPGFSGYEVLDR